MYIEKIVSERVKKLNEKREKKLPNVYTNAVRRMKGRRDGRARYPRLSKNEIRARTHDDS